MISTASDSADWISEDHRILGATRVANQLWFAWTAAPGQGGAGGFRFPRAHVQIAKLDLSQDLQDRGADAGLERRQRLCVSVDHRQFEQRGRDLAGLGRRHRTFGSHAVGILGDFVVWYGESSQQTSTRQQQDDAGKLLTNPDGTPMLYSRWGDYVHVRLAEPDKRFFSAFGYAVLKKSGATPPEKMDFLYVEFGRQPPPPFPGLH